MREYAIPALLGLAAVILVGGTFQDFFNKERINPITKRTPQLSVVEGMYDSDNNGWGSCSIYINGQRVDNLECSTAYWINFGCKAKVGIMSGGNPADSSQ
jgi:hypothetical protein